MVWFLIQHGKGADVGAAFGSGASGTVFGARGSATFMTRATAVLAALFFANSLLLAYLATHRPVTESVIDQSVQVIEEVVEMPSDEIQLAPQTPATASDLPGCAVSKRTCRTGCKLNLITVRRILRVTRQGRSQSAAK